MKVIVTYNIEEFEQVNTIIHNALLNRDDYLALTYARPTSDNGINYIQILPIYEDTILLLAEQHDWTIIDV